MADGKIEGNNIICGLHGWDYRFDTGVSEYNNDEALQKFSTEIVDGTIYIDEAEIDSFMTQHPQAFPEMAIRDFHTSRHGDTEQNDILMKRSGGLQTISLTQFTPNDKFDPV